MGVMADKDVDTILARLLPLAQMVIFTQPQYFRAATPRDLARRAQPYGLEILQTPRVGAAVQQAQSLAGPDDHIVVTGSLYTVGEAKEYFGSGVSGKQWAVIREPSVHPQIIPVRQGGRPRPPGGPHRLESLCHHKEFFRAVFMGPLAHL